MSNYTYDEKIYETENAVVYRAIKEGENSNIWAIKKYNNTFMEVNFEECVVSKIIENNSDEREIVPWIIEVNTENKYIVMQYKQNGYFLKEKLDIESTADLVNALTRCKNILESLNVLHKMNISHLDLHPGNIFFEITGRSTHIAKFIDFANSVIFVPEKQYNSVRSFTEGYSAPELHDGNLGSYAADIYSVTAILFFMLLRKKYEGYYEGYFRELYSVTNNYTMAYLLDTFLELGLHTNSVFRYSSAEDMLNEIEKIEKCHEAISKLDYWQIFNTIYDAGIITSINQKVFGGIAEEDTNKPERLYDVADCWYELRKKTNEILCDSYAYEEKNYVITLQTIENHLKQRDIDINKLYFIYINLFKIYLENSEKVKTEILVMLLSCGIRIGNHRAANWLFPYLEEINKKLSRDKSFTLLSFVDAKLAFANHYNDVLNYERAIDECRDCITRCEKYILSNGEFNCDVYYIEKAKALSALANFECFAGCYDDTTLEKYLQAIDLFTESFSDMKKREDNIAITVSHILHYAMEINDKKIYMKYIDTYLSENWIEKSQDYYQWLIAVKGNFYFEYPQINAEKVIELLVKLEEERSQRHPIQLIYKYIAMIIKKRERTDGEFIIWAQQRGYGRSKTEVIDKIIEISVECIKSARLAEDNELTILKLINYQTKSMHSDYKFDIEKTELKYALKQDIEKNCLDELKTELYKKYFPYNNMINGEINRNWVENNISLNELLKFEYA